MGNSAILILREENENFYFIAQHGANALSPLLKLTQALEWQELLEEYKSIAHIFERLDYKGNYRPERLMDVDMFFNPLTFEGAKVYMKNYEEHSELEMRFLIDLDEGFIQMEYNPNCPWYRTMGSFTFDLDEVLEKVQNLITRGNEHGINDFNKLLSIYHNSTGLADHLNHSRWFMRLEKCLGYPALEQKEDYKEMEER